MQVESIGSLWLWVGFGAFVVLMLALDLGVFHRRTHAVSIREAAIWSVVWIALALGFNAFVAIQWGPKLGVAFLTGYLIEKALSVDNLFVFYAIFSVFAVPAAYQHKILFWGIVGALVLRAVMVFGGAALLRHVHWSIYVFGIILGATGARMLMRPDAAPHPDKSRLYRWVTRVIPTTSGLHEGRFFAREGGALRATPLFLVLVLVELSDIVFAVDSVLAIFAISDDPFIVFTSNIFAVMGMRSLYFVLANMATRFVYLQPGLALVMIFVGAKMALSHVVKVSVTVSLLVVALLLGGSILASLLKSRRTPAK